MATSVSTARAAVQRKRPQRAVTVGDIPPMARSVPLKHRIVMDDLRTKVAMKKFVPAAGELAVAGMTATAAMGLAIQAAQDILNDALAEVTELFQEIFKEAA